MRNLLLRPLMALCLVFYSFAVNGQNTPPSCVITAPHNNAYFQEDNAVTIHVYASDLGGSFPAGNVTKVEFFADETKLGEATTGVSNTFTYVWDNVEAGTYRITATATDNENAAFTSAGVNISVGSEEVQPVGLSGGKGKYLANVIANNVQVAFNQYWNGVTAENSCKWGSVEGTRDVMSWSNADKAYNHALNNHMSFRYHALAWGSQYPSWITTLTPTEFQEEMEEYMAAVAARYPMIDQIDVLNENMHLNTWNGEEHAAGTPYFRDGLGGAGETGYDWVIWLFEKARSYFPDAKLVINDFELVTNANGRNEILEIIKVLRDRGLIDGFGTQSHYFNVDGLSSANLQAALNSMASSGVPVYVTELDIKGSPASEANQKTAYQRLFPVYWEHPAVAGITLWGYVEGSTWSDGTGILNSNASERAAMAWLKTYMYDLPDVGYPFVSGGSIPIDSLDNILSNGECNAETFPWQINNYNGGEGSMSIVSDANMSGDDALQICVTAPGTAAWHVQVAQAAPFTSGKTYEIRFMAKADEEASIIVTMQKGGDPYTQYMEEAINLTSENQSFFFPFGPAETDAINQLKFFVGLNSTCIYLDSIVFKEVLIEEIEKVDNTLNLMVYPNPVQSGSVHIEHISGENLNEVEIIDLNGRTVKTIQTEGSGATLEVSTLPKGIYFLRMHMGNAVKCKKLIVL